MTIIGWKPQPSKSGRPLALNDTEKEFVINFLEFEDISYALPGRKDQVYIGKSDGKRMYKAKHYLLWSLKDLLGLLNQENSVESFVSKFGRVMKFSTLYRIIKQCKHVYLNDDIPEESCLCEKCENLELLCQGIRSSVPYLTTTLPFQLNDIMKLFSCDLNNHDCATGNCQSCLKEDLTCLKEIDEVSFYQWGKTSNKYPEKLNVLAR